MIPRSIHRAIAIVLMTLVGAAALPAAASTIKVSAISDFEIDGKGTSSSWKRATWITLPHRKGSDPGYETRMKILYSETGLYFLFDCEDKKLGATLENDFDDLWTEDVVEIFLWTDESQPLYFEYEISPLNKELVLLVPNHDGKFMGWRPWHYEEDRLVQHATSVRGGPLKSGASIDGWTAEIFVPYALLKPLQNVPPKAGTQWRANFYRIDYDSGKFTSWEWQKVGLSFHDYKKFGTLEFK